MRSAATRNLVILLLSCSCSSRKEPGPSNLFSPTIVTAKGFKVSPDTIQKPEIVKAGKPKVVRAGKPDEFLKTSNVRPAGKPEVVAAGKPQMNTPGENGLRLPLVFAAIARPVPAGIPDIVVAKDPSITKTTSQNFKSFGKLQGLRSNDILSVIEDRQGNLWIGTNGSGLSKYDGTSFTNFTEKHGLGGGFVYDIIEDKKGNIWFATFNGGATKYDGSAFTTFSDAHGLCNGIQKVFEDRIGNLWFGSYGKGLIKYDGLHFSHFTKDQGLAGNNVGCITEDKHGKLWIGTDEGFSIYDGKTFLNFSKQQGLSDDTIFEIAEDTSGAIWVATQNGLNKFYQDQFFLFTTQQGIAGKYLPCLLVDKKNGLWIGSENGLSIYDGKTFTSFTEQEGFSNLEVWSMMEDKRGNIWIATGRDGLLSYNTGGFSTLRGWDVKGNIVLTSIHEDRLGNIWFSTRNRGVFKYDGNTFKNFTQAQGLAHDVVWNICEDSAGNLWFGTYVGVSRFDGINFTNFTEEQGLGSHDVHSLMQDSQGRFWFGTYIGGSGKTAVSMYNGDYFVNFSPASGLVNNPIIGLSFLEDGFHNIWIGTGGGLVKYDGETFTHFTVESGLPDNKIYSIIADEADNIWFTTSAGLCKYDGKKFTIFRQKDGLGNDDTQVAIKDKEGNLWIGTVSGLSKLDSKVKRNNRDRVELSATKEKTGQSQIWFRNFNYPDDFSASEINNLTVSKNGDLWICGFDKLMTFRPGNDSKDTIAPAIQLTGLTLFNENISWPAFKRNQDTSIALSHGLLIHDIRYDALSAWYGLPSRLSLPHNNNYLTFRFAGITTQSPQKIKYQYKLDGLENEWSNLTGKIEAPYGNLSPGNYTFNVKAINGDGYESRIFTYPFVIRPPWWRTWWAYVITAMIIFGIIYLFFRSRLNKIRLHHEVILQKHRMAELEMQALRAQMNPHFIFNSLSSINHFILRNESEAASDYLTKFSRLVRLVLNNSTSALITLEQELEMLNLYVGLEKLRFEHSFDYDVAVEKTINTLSVLIPPLVLQPFVENSIWHGLMNKAERGLLRIYFAKEDGFLWCSIIDNGVGRKKAGENRIHVTGHNRSVGMEITTKRLQEIDNDNPEDVCVVEDILSKSGNVGGTKVTLKIRYREAIQEVD